MGELGDEHPLEGEQDVVEDGRQEHREEPPCHDAPQEAAACDDERAVSTNALEKTTTTTASQLPRRRSCGHVPRADTEPKKSEESMVASLSAEKGRGSLTKKIHSPMRMKGRIIIKSKGV